METFFFYPKPKTKKKKYGEITKRLSELITWKIVAQTMTLSAGQHEKNREQTETRANRYGARF